MSNFKILCIEDIKLAQNIREAKILAFNGKALGVRVEQNYTNGNDGNDGNGA
jgi:hypothetical protein